MPQTVIDPIWIEDARNGGQNGATQLYKACYRNVYLTIKSMAALDEDTCLDLTQDTFVRAFQKLDQLDDPARFNAWIKQIARNTTLDYLRKKKAVVFISLTDDDSGSTIPESELEDSNIEHLPDAMMDRKETTRLINEILGSLPEQQRLVLGMYYYQNMKISEIAAALEKSEGTIKAQLNSGRKKIEAKVTQLEKDEGIKLYSLSPIAFLLLLLRDMDVGEPNADVLEKILFQTNGEKATGQAVESSEAAAKSADVGKAGASSGRKVGKVATAAVKRSIVGKVIAGVVAAAVVGGAATVGAVYISHRNAPAADISSASSTETSASAPPSDVPATPARSTNDEAHTAYASLIQRMIDDQSVTYQYAHLVDLNHDGIDELILVRDDTLFELYSFENGSATLAYSEDSGCELLWYDTAGFAPVAGESCAEAASKVETPIELMFYLVPDGNKTVLVIDAIQQLIGDLGGGFTAITYSDDGTSALKYNYDNIGVDPDGQYISKYYRNGEEISSDSYRLASTILRNNYVSTTDVLPDDTGYILGRTSERTLSVERDTPDNETDTQGLTQPNASSGDNSAYDGILEDYRAIIAREIPISQAPHLSPLQSSLVSSGIYLTPDALPAEDENGYLTAESYANKITEFYYAYYDVNQDGTDELLIRRTPDYDNTILDLFTVYDGEVSLLDSGKYRFPLEICAEGVYCAHSTGGQSQYAFYYGILYGRSADIICLHSDPATGTYEIDDTPCDETEYEQALSAYHVIPIDSFDWHELGTLTKEN